MMAEHVIQILEGTWYYDKRGNLTGTMFLDGKRITALTKEETFAEAEVIISSYPNIVKDIQNGNIKCKDYLKGKLNKGSDNLIHPHHIDEFLLSKFPKKVEPKHL